LHVPNALERQLEFLIGCRNQTLWVTRAHGQKRLFFSDFVGSQFSKGYINEHQARNSELGSVSRTQMNISVAT